MPKAPLELPYKARISRDTQRIQELPSLLFNLLPIMNPSLSKIQKLIFLLVVTTHAAREALDEGESEGEDGLMGALGLAWSFQALDFLSACSSSWDLFNR